MRSRPRPVSRVEVVVVVVRVAAQVGSIVMIGWYTAGRADVKVRSRCRPRACAVDDEHLGKTADVIGKRRSDPKIEWSNIHLFRR
jgi:hypothetical protein